MLALNGAQGTRKEHGRLSIQWRCCVTCLAVPVCVRLSLSFSLSLSGRRADWPAVRVRLWVRAHGVARGRNHGASRLRPRRAHGERSVGWSPSQIRAHRKCVREASFLRTFRLQRPRRSSSFAHLLPLFSLSLSLRARACSARARRRAPRPNSMRCGRKARLLPVCPFKGRGFRFSS